MGGEVEGRIWVGWMGPSRGEGREAGWVGWVGGDGEERGGRVGGIAPEREVGPVPPDLVGGDMPVESGVVRV